MLNVVEAIMEIYPSISGGFAYWHTKDDGTPWDNLVDGLVWENEQFEKPSWQKIESKFPVVELRNAKQRKINEVKIVRDRKNISPITDYKAFLIDDEGNKTNQESYFIFYTNRHQTNPASDPESIISRSKELGSMPYFTKDLEGKKITVELTAEIAVLLKQRIFERNDNNYKVSGSIEEAINNAQSIEELQAIQLEE